MTFSQTTSQRYTASVTFDNFNIGRSAAQYVVETLNGKGNIVELCGEDRDISAIDLHSGFNFGISSYPEIKTTVINNINWDEKASNRIIDSMLRSGCEIAYEVGFSAPSYFSKCYKEHYGISPIEVR